MRSAIKIVSRTSGFGQPDNYKISVIYRMASEFSIYFPMASAIKVVSRTSGFGQPDNYKITVQFTEWPVNFQIYFPMAIEE